MLVRYWQPWREMDLMRRQFDQLFNELTQPVESQTEQLTWNPAIELQDTGDDIVVRAQLPGMDAKDLDVEVMKEAVSIAGERHHEQKTEENGFFQSEFRYGKFRRIVPLPVAVQNDKVQAEYKDGVLTLALPKVEGVRNKVVKVDLTASEQAAA
jgi:HSP20 family protein